MGWWGGGAGARSGHTCFARRTDPAASVLTAASAVPALSMQLVSNFFVALSPASFPSRRSATLQVDCMRCQHAGGWTLRLSQWSSSTGRSSTRQPRWLGPSRPIEAGQHGCMPPGEQVHTCCLSSPAAAWTELETPSLGWRLFDIALTLNLMSQAKPCSTACTVGGQPCCGAAGSHSGPATTGQRLPASAPCGSPYWRTGIYPPAACTLCSAAWCTCWRRRSFTPTRHGGIRRAVEDHGSRALHGPALGAGMCGGQSQKTVLGTRVCRNPGARRMCCPNVRQSGRPGFSGGQAHAAAPLQVYRAEEDIWW